MKDRIIKIMNLEGLTPSRFAEEIGIQRAAMSHIMSGRNKPSLDVVTKIMERYPSINATWLLMGNGEMSKNEDLTSHSVSVSKPKQKTPDLFANPSNIRQQIEKKPEIRKEIVEKRNFSTSKVIDKEKSTLKEGTSRKIEKIMIFYSDNTYEVFNPEK